jgi:N-acetylglucosaminyldiphosphoundecaprenol N-acetyl-beta-D-mannosaminyltransferase
MPTVRRVQFLGTPLDALTLEETVALAVEAMRSRLATTHVALNVAKLVHMKTNEELRRDVAGADIIGVDGMGVVWGARMLGINVPERVTGIDLMGHILGECARAGYRPYFLGATRAVVEAAVEEATRAHTGLQFAGYRDGYYRDTQVSDLIEAINASGADCLFVGMPSPRKERFLAAHRHAIKAPFVMGVGGSFDVMAGKVARAPSWIQGAGFEWLYRLCQEPRRLIWRYARTNSLFLFLLLREILGHRTRVN